MNNFLKRIIKINPLIILLTLSFFTISFKWISLFYIYPGEDMILKNILDLEDIYYFPYIINLSELNFMPNYIDELKIDKLLLLPIYSIMFHSIFYILFKDVSFLIIEFLSLSFFLILFFKIFKELKLSDHISILLSVAIFLFCEFSDTIFMQMNITSINTSVFSNLYSLRVPRPSITSLYFLFSILLIIKIYKNENQNIFYYVLGVFLGLILGSFYYQFVILILLTFYVLCINFVFKKNIQFFNLFKKIQFIIIPFLIITIPPVILGFLSEPDFLKRIGVLHLDLSQKKIILFYLFSKLLEYKFLLLLILNTFLFIFLYKEQNNLCKKTLSIFYFLFISSIASPLLFIALSPSISEIYHFLNQTILFGIFIFLLFSILYFLNLFNNNFIKKFFINIYFKEISFFLLTGFFIFLLYFNYLTKLDKSDKNFRDDLNLLHNYLKLNNSKLNNLMTFDIRVQVWWLFNDKKKLTSIDSSLISLTNSQLESNFIQNLKYLKIPESTFNLILQNNKKKWRYDNVILKYFSWYKYQANSMITFDNSNDFDQNILIDINQTPPTRSQQIIIPIYEQKRLKEIYMNYNKNFAEGVDIIVLRKNSIIGGNAFVDKNKFCKLSSTKEIIVYINNVKAKCS